jgi:hypothetical protein
MGIDKQFDSMTDMLKNMSYERKMDLINTHKDFARLKELCRAKKYIEVMQNMSGVIVLKKTTEVIALKQLIDKLNPLGIKWIEGGKDLLDKNNKKG